MQLTRFLYLCALVVSASGVVVLASRLGLGVSWRRLVVAVALTVPVFLGVDAIGAARGWFRSNPALNVAIFPPGISLEEPLLLAFLVLISVSLWRAAARWAG